MSALNTKLYRCRETANVALYNYELVMCMTHLKLDTLNPGDSEGDVEGINDDREVVVVCNSHIVSHNKDRRASRYAIHVSTNNTQSWSERNMLDPLELYDS